MFDIWLAFVIVELPIQLVVTCQFCPLFDRAVEPVPGWPGVGEFIMNVGPMLNASFGIEIPKAFEIAFAMSPMPKKSVALRNLVSTGPVCSSM